MADDGVPLRLHLTELKARLDELMAENNLMRERAMNAAAEARTWPDMKRATQLFVDAHCSTRGMRTSGPTSIWCVSSPDRSTTDKS
jgi:16S rRNA C967 or C1407 C5-methylase (RsmB/RsmF family)